MKRQDIREVHLIHAGEDPDTLLRPLARGIEKYFKQPDLVTYETFGVDSTGSEVVCEKVATAIRDAAERRIHSAVIISKKFLDILCLHENKDYLIGLIVDEHRYNVFVPIWLGVDLEAIDRYSRTLASKRPVRGEHYATDSENFEILAETLAEAWLGHYIPSEGDDSQAASLSAGNEAEHLRSREPVESVDPSLAEPSSDQQEQPTTSNVTCAENNLDLIHLSDHPNDVATSEEARPANQQQEGDGSACCDAAIAGNGLHLDYQKGLDKLNISEEEPKNVDGKDASHPHPSDAPNEAVASNEARPANQQQEEGESSCCETAIGAGGCDVDPEKGLSCLNHDGEDSSHGSQGVPSMGSRNTATASTPAGGASTAQPAAPATGGAAAAAAISAAAGEQGNAPARQAKQKPANIQMPGAGTDTNPGNSPLDGTTDEELKSPIPENGHDNKRHKCASSEVIVPPGAFYNGTSDPSQDTTSPSESPEFMVDLNQDLLDDLKMKLDPQMPLIKNWRNFGSRNGIKNQELNYIDYCARQGQSPTEVVFQKLPHYSVKKFKEDCKFYKRMDVLEVMKKHGF